jgi:hypothetical protein
VLEQGRGLVSKVQIREVTSHFQKGNVILVVYPKSSPAMKSNITPADIRPCIVERLIVKAKKITH